MGYYLAVDIGASSGRHILGHRENGKLCLEEVYRFENGMSEEGGYKVWDSRRLYGEILAGMKRCAELGRIPDSMGIDTWAVDFALLDGDGALLGPTVAYRDGRTEGMDEKVYAIIPQEELYRRTGIQKQPFNTIYQLMAVREKEPEKLAQAETMLLIPDYFHFLLTGERSCEYTNASTTQLLNAQTKDWDWELIDRLGFPRRMFCPLSLPGTCLGELLPEVAREVGFSCRVVLPATHDTASAVLAVPCEADDVLYISSGTWSLMGTELRQANCSAESMAHNLTNEGGYEYRFRFLKNIMGLWMINSAKKELAPGESFAAICESAKRERISSLVDADDARFLAPESMSDEIRRACEETGQPAPEGMGQTAAVIYRSLAACYARTAKEIEALTGKHYTAVHVVGGGSHADYLNELTANACGVPVLAGPAEATAAGNLAAQMIAAGELSGLTDARRCIRTSFEIREFFPAGS